MQSPLFHTNLGSQAMFMQGVRLPTATSYDAAQAPSIYTIAKAYGAGQYPKWKVTDSSFPRISFTTTVRPLTSCQIVSSAAEAEQQIFDLLPDSLTETVDLTAPFSGTLHNPLPIYINRAANRIASRTRRGAGNVALMHWNTWTMLYPNGDVCGISAGVNEQCGRWTHKGFVNSSIKLYVGNDIPVNEVFVAYVGGNKGLTDGPLALVENSGYHYAVHAPAYANVLSQASDYVYRLRY